MFSIHELIHIILSLAVGWFLYRYAKSIWVFAASFLGGFFIDVDHLYDYLKFKGGFSFNLNELTAGKYFDTSHKVFIIFHGYEYAIVLLLIGLIILAVKSKSAKLSNTFAICLIAFSASMFLHLLFDQIYYKPKLLTYSIIYRASIKFDHDSMGFQKTYNK